MPRPETWGVTLGQLVGTSVEGTLQHIETTPEQRRTLFYFFGTLRRAKRRFKEIEVIPVSDSLMFYLHPFTEPFLIGLDLRGDGKVVFATHYPSGDTFFHGTGEYVHPSYILPAVLRVLRA